MNFQAAIQADLIASITAATGLTEARAAQELKNAKVTAKATGLTVAEVLRMVGLV